MLELINTYFNNIGRIITNPHDNTFNLKITGLINCLIVRDHFINYPLFTYKLVHFQLWCMIIDLIQSKQHLTWLGLLQIIGIKEHFKEGLSEKLLFNFPFYIPISTPVYNPLLFLMNIHWICGFINSDGSFSLLIRKDAKLILGERCSTEISITQHSISLIVLERINSFLGYGSVKPKSDKPAYRFRISSLANVNSFINLFKEAQFLGAKALDYADFCKGVEIINSGKHLTQAGLESIRLLSKGMNSNRTKFE